MVGAGVPHVPLFPRQRLHVVGREGSPERGAELAACARDQDGGGPGGVFGYTRSVTQARESVGVLVLHRSLTRGSSQGIPCSSGSAGSYSSVT